jgi:hypothetical protein
MKDLESFRFEESPVNGALVRSLHDGTWSRVVHSASF